jgi:branched-chain amino acid transport system substrate-binding protein
MARMKEMPIKIGEINSYGFAALGEFTRGYRRGIELAINIVNNSGGAAGRPLEVIFRDDRRDKEEAARQARDLLENEKVDLLAGTFASDIATIVGEIASAHRRIFVAGEPRGDALVWSAGSRYVFRIRTSQYTMASVLVDSVMGHDARRWATISPGYPGQGVRMADVFRRVLSDSMPDVQWVGAIHFPLGNIDPAAAVSELAALDPEALFAVVYGDDLAVFMHELNARKSSRKRLILSPFAGDPEYIGSLNIDVHDDWITLGYPATEDLRPAPAAFATAYHRQYGEAPQFGSLIGYLVIQTIAAAINKAGSTDTEALIQALRGLSFDSAIGPMKIRAGDHQSTMGAWIGKLGFENGRNHLANWKFVDGSDFLPSEAESAAMRPVEANQ